MSIDELLAEFVSHETDDRIAAFAAGLESGSLGLASTDARLEYVLPPGPKTVARASALLGAWPSGVEVGAASLAAALRGAAGVRRQVEERGPVCELAWTGPNPPFGVRTTDQVVVEMLSRASREIVIVQYAVTSSGASKAVFGRLGELSREGVRITWIVDAGWDDGRSIRSVKSTWPNVAPRPRLMSYVAEDDEMAKLHAKVLIVDDRDLFVSSANLTGYGYGVNLEFGVRVQGQPAVDAAAHFDELVRGNLLTDVSW